MKDRRVQLALAIGEAIDRDQARNGKVPTIGIAETLAMMTASAAVICNPRQPAAGVEHVYHAFLDELATQCHKHKIPGVHVVEVDPDAVVRGGGADA